MEVWLIRHGQTEYNKRRQYQGQKDIPVSEEGKAEILPSKEAVEEVYVTSLSRTAQTAKILFPEALQIPVPAMREMDFGAFEGRSYEDMRTDPEYRAWVEGGCLGVCPGGESRRTFSARVCPAFEKILEEGLQKGKSRLIFVIHGGTIMAIMEKYGLPRGEYYEWLPDNVGGYVAEVSEAAEGELPFAFSVKSRISYRKGAGRMHLYYGDGKGKSSAAAGLALRALHAGWGVYYVQLCKSDRDGSPKILEKCGAKVYYGKDDPGFVSAMGPDEKQQLKAVQDELLFKVKESIRRDKEHEHKLLVLDEACAALEQEVIREEILWDMVIRRRPEVEVVLTGRHPAPWMIEAADYMTKMNCEKHIFTQGVQAREGIEF